jgi:hypothetical protein
MSFSSSPSDAASNIFSSGLGLASNNTSGSAAALASLYNFTNVNTVKLSPENYLLWRAGSACIQKSHAARLHQRTPPLPSSTHHQPKGRRCRRSGRDPKPGVPGMDAA